MRIRVRQFTMQIIDGIKIKVYKYRLIASVADAVVISIRMLYAATIGSSRRFSRRAGAASQKQSQYRVDKIVDIALTDMAREGRESFEHMDMAEFSKKTFGMFAGEEKTVRLRCENSLTGVIIDTFGTNVAIRPDGEHHFIARMEVVVSSQFFGWLVGLGARVEIISPDEVREEYTSYLTNIISRYDI